MFALGESTPEEKEQARWDQEVMRQRRLPETWGKSDEEIAKLSHDALYGRNAKREVVV
jgi:hypothetical protein